MSSTAVRNPGRELRAWLTGLAVVAVLVGVLAAAGGLRTLTGPQRFVRPGEVQDLGRWLISIDSAELVDTGVTGSKLAGPAVRLHYTLTNTGDRTQQLMSNQIIRVDLPNGDRFGSGAEAFSFRVLGRGGAIDPGQTRPVYSELRLKARPWTGEGVVRVRLGYEEKNADSYLDPSGSWEMAYEVAAVEVPCPDRRSS